MNRLPVCFLKLSYFTEMQALRSRNYRDNYKYCINLSQWWVIWDDPYLTRCWPWRRNLKFSNIWWYCTCTADLFVKIYEYLVPTYAIWVMGPHNYMWSFLAESIFFGSSQVLAKNVIWDYGRVATVLWSIIDSLPLLVLEMCEALFELECLGDCILVHFGLRRHLPP